MESNLVPLLLKKITSEQRNANLIFFFLQRGKISADLDCLVWLQQSPIGFERNFVLIFFRNAPLVFDRDAGVILNLEFLLGLNTHVGRRKKQLFLLKADCWRIAEALQLHLLHIH